MYRRPSCVSDSWTCSRKSMRRHPSHFSQDFENVDSLDNSFDAGKIKSLSLPYHSLDSFMNDTQGEETYLEKIKNMGMNLKNRLEFLGDNVRNKSSDTLVDQKRRAETYFEKIKNYGTNLRFRIGDFGENIWYEDAKKDKAYLLGKEYETEKPEDMKKMKADFSEIIWFSYRTNFPKLNYKLIPLADSFVSDTGWGCMVRVCQMIFAECLRRYFIEKKGYPDGKSSRLPNQVRRELDENDKENLNYKIISWFLDTELDAGASPYSIQNLSVCLHERFKLKPGIWLKPSSVLFALQEIQRDYGYATAPELQMEIYIESTIYVTQALKKVTYKDNSSDDSFDKAFAEEFEVVDGEGAVEAEEDEEKGEIKELFVNQDENNKENENENEDQNKKQEEEEETCSPIPQDIDVVEANDQDNDKSIESIYINEAREMDKLLKHRWKDALLVFMLAKTGLDRPNPEYTPFIKDLLSFPESVGMIGGKPGFAYYIVGYTEDKLMYLDPHYVQESVQNKEDLKENMSTYFSQTIRHVGFNDIDTSVTFGFFIKDEISFKSFLERFRHSCQSNESFFGVELNAPQENTTDVESVCEDYTEERKVRDEDGFEML